MLELLRKCVGELNNYIRQDIFWMMEITNVIIIKACNTPSIR